MSRFLLSARTLYIFFSIKMFVWCSIVFLLHMNFSKLNPAFEIRTIPIVQYAMILTGAVALINLFKERYVVTLITSLIMLFIWCYAAVGYYINNFHDPTWIRVAIEMVFVQVLMTKVLRNKGLD